MSTTASCGCGCGGTLPCGCCAGVEALTPQPTANRPRLSKLSYRIGTHGSFLQTMQARLSSQDFPALSLLTTRDSNDPAMALLDAWAGVGDVLTFYQERIANEGYIGTATEMRSVFELARLVGYRPRPGVAASVYLAYTIDANTKEEVVIAKGARSQSVPGPGETPQSFETSEPLRARANWNVLKPRTRQPQRLSSIRANRRLYLQSVTTNLNPNDPLLVVERGFPELFRVTELLVDHEKAETLVKLVPWAEQAAQQRPTPAAAMQPLVELLGDAPTGAVAERIVATLEPLRERAVAANAGELLPQDAVTASVEAIDAELATLGRLPAQRLRGWAADVRAAIFAAGRAAAPAAANDASISVATIVNRLSRRPSQPLANALRLPRSLGESFRANGDSSLQVVGAISPALRENLAPALAAQSDPKSDNELEVYAFRVRAGVFGRNAQQRQRIVREDRSGVTTTTEPIGEWPIVEFGERTSDFVRIAAGARAMVERIHEKPLTLNLDNSHDGILAGSWIVVDSSAAPEKGTLVHRTDDLTITRSTSVHSKITRNAYGMSGDTTRIALVKPWMRLTDGVKEGEQFDLPDQKGFDLDFQLIRGTTVFARAEKLPLAEEPIEAELCGGTAEEPVELDGLYSELEPGRFVVLSGERTGLGEDAKIRASEALMISSVVHDTRAADELLPWTDVISRAPGTSDSPEKLPGDKVHTFVWFDRPLNYCYRRNTVEIQANVVKATHGETRNEIVGNGDGSKPLQSFTLKQFPLTYLAAPTAVGAESTLQVFVNDVRWHQRDSFVDAQPTDRIFVTRADEKGEATLVFGNGREGMRLPTGIANVKTEYRFQIGAPGNVRAGQITQLSTRPLGVKDVVNPLRASGGADRESRDQARRNAPNAVMSLDRLVSVRDYADFARSFAGIGKAAAAELSDGGRSLVHVSIAGSSDIPIDPDSDLFRNLRRALHDLGDPFQPVTLATRELRILIVSAGIRIHPDYRWESVVTEVRNRLLAHFGFERRDLGQDATSSEVLSVIQSVRGVTYVDLDSFGAVDSMTPDPNAELGSRPLTPDEIAEAVRNVVEKPPERRVRAWMARLSDDGTAIRPAQLAVLVPDVPATLVLNRIE